MRVWNEIDPSRLCRNHLLAEHREILCIWSVLTKGKKGYRNHPEVKRWGDSLGALWLRHNHILKESKKRKYNFKDLPHWSSELYLRKHMKNRFVTPKSWDNQEKSLSSKNCDCIKRRT